MMIIVLLIKFIYLLRIYMNQNINILLKNMNTLFLSTAKIRRLLLNIQIICKMPIKCLINTTQRKNLKYQWPLMI